MSIYHKGIELLVTIVSLVSIAFNFLLPHVAIAKDIARNNVLSFNFSETAKVLPIIFTENNNIALADESNISGMENEANNLPMLPIEITTEERNDKIAEKICKDAGLEDLPCWQDLKAMRDKESFGGKVMTGDGGRSRGWYHIQIKMHGVSDACALDFKCSTEWTVKNLITNGYKTNRVYAISRHNGSGKMADIYARSIVYNSAKFK